MLTAFSLPALSNRMLTLLSYFLFSKKKKKKKHNITINQGDNQNATIELMTMRFRGIIYIFITI